MSTPEETVHPLRAFRQRMNYTQPDAARLLGVSYVTVSRWETGERKIDSELVLKISRLTGIPVAQLRPDLAALFQGE